MLEIVLRSKNSDVYDVVASLVSLLEQTNSAKGPTAMDRFERESDMESPFSLFTTRRSRPELRTPMERLLNESSTDVWNAENGKIIKDTTRAKWKMHNHQMSVLSVLYVGQFLSYPTRILSSYEVLPQAFMAQLGFENSKHARFVQFDREPRMIVVGTVKMPLRLSGFVKLNSASSIQSVEARHEQSRSEAWEHPHSHSRAVSNSVVNGPSETSAADLLRTKDSTVVSGTSRLALPVADLVISPPIRECTQGAASASSSNTTGPTADSANSTQSRGTTKTQPSCTSSGDSSNDADGRPPPGPPSTSSAHGSARFACPRQMHSMMHNLSLCSYSGVGWPNMSEVIKHLKRAHSISIWQCKQCHEYFRNLDVFQGHNQEPRPCLRTHNRGVMNQGRLWRQLYQLLFPGETVVPDPYYESGAIILKNSNVGTDIGGFSITPEPHPGFPVDGDQDRALEQTVERLRDDLVNVLRPNISRTPERRRQHLEQTVLALQVLIAQITCPEYLQPRSDVGASGLDAAIEAPDTVPRPTGLEFDAVDTMDLEFDPLPNLWGEYGGNLGEADDSAMYGHDLEEGDLNY
ncbi:uncharacterized protein BDZ99DRAFT_142483 [Mytilinidion resinicola]|uniref:C2H2-type domain-containing protein n=1 Tax=Mytilinidion resinicola TaxID=574789 RepID=A0A6A6Y880_9PEZI|nr:uncharacterized protein BDZ99DRAFT_142483 [Mytilinidion resinicola]KAF2804758.1 hypothetical protein BDZ99DRAFT_142483 [Mytilinidion resinicola]